MATQEEFRRWMRGEDVAGMPSRKALASDDQGSNDPIKKFADALEASTDAFKSTAAAVARFGRLLPRGDSTHGRYDIVDGGTDAVLKFGKHKGFKVSELASDKEGCSYLKWMTEGPAMLASCPELISLIKAYIHPLSAEAEELATLKE